MTYMELPSFATDCLQALEQAGYAAYAVGGCVRDACLGKIPHDYDLCTAALPEQIQQVFKDSKLVLAGVRHGTVGVITEGGVVEITTFRSEGGYEDHRHPDWVAFVPRVEEDLARRDFTVNAMAYSPMRGFADPFGGREDLKKGILRAVGNPSQRFQEDALRILRGIRFASRFHLRVDPSTMEAMIRMAPLMEDLARERVFEELSRFLLSCHAEDLREFEPILSEAVPDLKPMVGFDQRTPYHAYDLYTHTIMVVSQVPSDLTLRWAALLHDTGKIPTFTLDEKGHGHFYGHNEAGAQIADRVLRTLRSPTALREDVMTLILHHMDPQPENKKALRRRVSRMGLPMTEKLWELQRADLCSKGADVTEALKQFSQIKCWLQELSRENACLKLRDLKLNGHDLMALGYEGKSIGDCLNRLFSLVLDEKIPNDREALLEEARKTITKTTC